MEKQPLRDLERQVQSLETAICVLVIILLGTGVMLAFGI